MKLEFIKTCGACPEQYDVFDENDNQVAYIRLRWGYLSVEYDGKEIYSHTFSDDMKGSFDNEEERQKYLSIIRKKIGWKEKVTNFLNNPGKDFVTKEEYDKIMDSEILKKEVIQIEICRSEYIENKFNIRIGDIKGSGEDSNFTKEEVLSEISDKIDELLEVRI